jgi:D-glycero-alpha-D-manno-heptose-7-phosphate kinase
MIITRTPYRVSLFGGGTDHPDWYRDNGGSVLSFAIDKYSYINIRELPPFFEHTYRVVYSKVELGQDISEIKHPAVREGFRKFASRSNLELHHHGDLPARSGVGSSSAFAVGLIHALLALDSREVAPSELAQMAIDFEQITLGETVGSQDQIACALGGVNYIQFGPGNTWSSQKLDVSPNYQKKIEARIVLLYSGIDRISSDVSKSLLENLETKFDAMKRTQELANEGRNILDEEGDLSQIGPMLVESWELKKKMNPQAVTPHLEEFFERARKNGAEGGKVLGAGGGGFCLFWVSPPDRESFIRKMAPAVAVPIRVSWEGSTRIL